MEKLSKDDPRFTAKALGELSEELDALEISAEDKSEFEETVAFVNQLEAEFDASKESDTLSGDQIEELEKSHSRKGRRNVLLWIPAWTYSIAACLAIGVFSVVVLNRTTEEMSYIGPMQIDSYEEPPPGKGPSQSLVEGDGFFPERAGESAPGTVYSEVRVEASKMRLSNMRYFEDVGTSPLVAENDNSQLSESLNGQVQLAFEKPESEPRLQSLDLALNPGIAAPTPMIEESVSFSEFSENNPILRQRLSSASSANAWSDTLTSSPLRGIGSFSRLPKMVPAPPVDREGYDPIEDNDFRSPLDNPLSTFSIDVDTASYSNVRRMINGGGRPVPDAVRIEELVNYFRYDYPQPEGTTPFSVNIESAGSPWNSERQLVRIGLKGKTIEAADRPDANLVFLVDVSGSMGQANKLPLAQEALKLLVEQMGTDDRIAIVVYAGSSGLALPSTTANNQETIRHAIDNLSAGGSTNGGAGIELAYKVATDKFIDGGINRVILCTDGDFNVGVSDDGSLVRLIEAKAKSGVFFSAIGFGQGNYQDGKMEQLSNKGNGNYAYIDTKQEARKVFVDDMLGMLHTIAKDVKIQVDFNPSQVNAYRLIGYVNRILAKEDFNDDQKDAGEIGAGHTVTALYEIVPAGVAFETREVDASKYQRPATQIGKSDEWLTVKLRFKEPDEDLSQLVEFPFTGNADRSFEDASSDFRFASSVAGFGMILRDSAHIGAFTLEDVIEIARNAKAYDPAGLRSDFVELVRKTKPLLEE